LTTNALALLLPSILVAAEKNNLSTQVYVLQIK